MLVSQASGGMSGTGFSLSIRRTSTAATTTDIGIRDGWTFKLCVVGVSEEEGDSRGDIPLDPLPPSLRFSVLSSWIRGMAGNPRNYLDELTTLLFHGLQIPGEIACGAGTDPNVTGDVGPRWKEGGPD